MKKHFIHFGCICGLSWITLGAAAQVTLNLDVNQRGAKISPTLYSIFFEEINHAGDGGLYAELVANRSFECNSNKNNPLDYWKPYSGAQVSVVDTTSAQVPMLNDAQAKAAMITTTMPGQGIENDGYKGINVVEGRQYSLTLFARSAKKKGTSLTVRLMSHDGSKVLGSLKLRKLTNKWEKLHGIITATGSDERGCLIITADEAGTFCLDVVSLFPPTFKSRPNGMRIDLAQALADLHPAVMRFPGGCYVEGEVSERSLWRRCGYEWKKTIGPIEERPGHWNANWRYEVTDGMGAMEYLQFCEDIGAEPLFVCNNSTGHGWQTSIDSTDVFVQDALDFIEFCRGDASTTWGRKRIELGRSEPFRFRLMEIGNECNPRYSDKIKDGYYVRYKKFYEAIKAKYPDIIVIGNGYNSAYQWNFDYPTDVIDEHYYDYAQYFISQYHAFDNVSRQQPLHYIGEWAVYRNFGSVGNLEAALAESVYMCGLEKNSDVVMMSAYAPIFRNDDLGGWWPTEMIHFTNHDYFVTPSYYAQMLFASNLGTQNLKVEEQGNATTDYYRVGVATDHLQAEFTDMSITYPDRAGFSPAIDKRQWTSYPKNAKWEWSGSRLSHTDIKEGAVCADFDRTLDADTYTYSLKLRATEGSGTLSALFNHIDFYNYCALRLGGLEGLVVFEQHIGGQTHALSKAPFILETGRLYDVKIEVTGRQAKAYIDGSLVCQCDMREAFCSRVFTSANISADNTRVFVRVVNPYPHAQDLRICISNSRVKDAGGQVLCGNRLDENTALDAARVKPQAIIPAVTDAHTVTYNVPAYSANFINIEI